MAFEPGASGSGYRFENRTPDAAVPRALVRGVEKGLEAVRQLGATHGFPVIDFTAILLDGAFHAQDSTLLTFEIAARAAFREAMQKAQCQLLEPIMKVEVALPMSFAHEIIDAIAADLDQRRCEHRGLEERGNIGVLRAFVPLANMFGYGNTLRALTQRRGTFDMVFDHYAPIPGPDDEPFRPAVGMRA
jgi:elongation factor G